MLPTLLSTCSTRGAHLRSSGSGSHGGSHTVSTWQALTPGMAMIASCTMTGSSCALGQPGAVSVISTFTCAVIVDLDRVDQAELVDVHRDFRVIDGARSRRSSRPRRASVAPSGVQRTRQGPHSLVASFPPSSAASSARHGRVTHFTRDGYSCTAESGRNLVERRVARLAMPGPRHRLDLVGQLPDRAPASGPATASHIRSALAMLISQPRASNPASEMVSPSRRDEDLDPVAAHRVVAPRRRRRTPSGRPECAGRAAVPPDLGAVEVADRRRTSGEELAHAVQRVGEVRRSRPRSCRCRGWRARCCPRRAGASAARRSDCRRAPRCPARSSRVATSCAWAPCHGEAEHAAAVLRLRRARAARGFRPAAPAHGRSAPPRAPRWRPKPIAST